MGIVSCGTVLVLQHARVDRLENGIQSFQLGGYCISPDRGVRISKEIANSKPEIYFFGRYAITPASTYGVQACIARAGPAAASRVRVSDSSGLVSVASSRT